MNKTDVIKWVVGVGVIPVVRASSAEEALSVIEAIAEGGVTCIEVTMTVPNAVDVIAKLSKREELLIGAGTVLEPETARECIVAGAKFIVSPATNFDTIEYCNQTEIVVMPGALTPTEVVNAWDAGADFVKVFPADSMGGPKYLRSLKAPLPAIKLIPTGGVSQSTAADFIRAGAEAVGVGADLVDLKAVRDGRSSDITQAARNYLAIVAGARKNPAAA
ncbi:MAG TPA: bifunctional 4-hydroxy-2-oxoglutarate aldolase/2-dehydro-3-deoxy-phosphogluconate aldolase [Pyrinomonadaceae bacterium]|jgi:2-dehydro-3-deoxyphosphogluconate aldolase/(4S)-4-hydroxy-2-oxoglutarate aldolase|nr:bifunctional 4-hydroxy-2-oxoglutarate aldolase/2-dehydro-3-deoxy-phosphogluconate aldolase [Pyrinomonadaceae bacterium]